MMFFFTQALLAAATLAPPPSMNVPVRGEFVHAGAALDGATWSRLQSTSVAATGHDQQTATYGGVRLADLLSDSGAPVGDQVRGKAARAYLVVGAADRYTAIFSLAELDPAEVRCAPILANSRDGLALGTDDGPLMVVAPCDRTHARWVRQVTGLTIVVAADGSLP